MDTEEDHKIQLATREGRPQTDEGPYYHESWWESYKGGVKGKFGGAVIGALTGAAMGIIGAGVVAVAAGGIGIAAAIGIAATFSAGGMLYGAHEFSDVGKVTGAVAAAHQESEARMKSFEAGKFAEIRHDINDIKRMMGAPVSPEAAEPPKVGNKLAHNGDYRTQHCNDGHCPPKDRRIVFWKIALIGLAVGMAAGALLAFGGGAAHLLHAIGGAAAEHAISQTGITLASMGTLGLFGASFGINRDIFRGVFDRTDLLFKGIFSKEPQLAKAQEPSCEPCVDTPQKPVPVVYESQMPYPKSDTYHRDRVVEQAKRALLSLDHTQVTPH